VNIDKSINVLKSLMEILSRATQKRKEEEERAINVEDDAAVHGNVVMTELSQSDKVGKF